MMFMANTFHGVFSPSDIIVSFNVALLCFLEDYFPSQGNVKKKQTQPTIPNIPITIRNPKASFPLPVTCTRVRAVADTIEDPRKARNFLQVAKTVLSFMSSVKVGKIDAKGILTTVYINDKKCKLRKHRVTFHPAKYPAH